MRKLWPSDARPPRSSSPTSFPSEVQTSGPTPGFTVLTHSQEMFGRKKGTNYLCYKSIVALLLCIILNFTSMYFLNLTEFLRV